MGFTIYWRSRKDRPPITKKQLEKTLVTIDSLCEEHPIVLTNEREGSTCHVIIGDDTWPVETFRFGRVPPDKWKELKDERRDLYRLALKGEYLTQYIRQGRIRFGWCKTNRHPEGTELVRELLKRINQAVDGKLVITDDDNLDPPD